MARPARFNRLQPNPVRPLERIGSVGRSVRSLAGEGRRDFRLLQQSLSRAFARQLQPLQRGNWNADHSAGLTHQTTIALLTYNHSRRSRLVKRDVGDTRVKNVAVVKLNFIARLEVAILDIAKRDHPTETDRANGAGHNADLFFAL